MSSHDFKRGDMVLYVPDEAKGDINHRVCMEGCVQAVLADGSVVVRFVEPFGLRACPPGSLLPETGTEHPG